MAPAHGFRSRNPWHPSAWEEDEPDPVASVSKDRVFPTPDSFMCGIAGFINREGQGADRDVLARMTATVAHRGPDGEGLLVDGPAALGHRRLAIIDPEGGAQPMANEDGSVWVTYNGELYNEPALRAGMLTRGHTYRTSCDTESLVHLYEENGPEFVRLLNGMFALA